MVPDIFIGYFSGAATAAGTLIGPLFVAISLRPESVLGAGAPARAQAVAGSAFTALVNGFFISLIAPKRPFVVYTIAYVVVGAFAAALGRAWSLLQGRHTPQARKAQPQETQGQ